MKKMALVLFVLLATAGMVFAGGKSDSGSGKIVMGALIRNLNETFVRDYADNLKKLASANNVDLRLLDGNGDVATQLDQLNTLLTQGVKYFVIIPQDTSATEQMCKAIQARGGAAAFSNIQPSVAALKVGKNFFLASSPETVAGDIQAQIADSYFKKYPDQLGPNKTINLILLEGQLGHPAQVNREKGALEGLAKLGYNVNIVAKDTANWGAAEAQQKMDAWIAAYRGQFNLVLAQNDDMALGAVESMLTNKYTDDPNNITKDTNGDGTVLKVPVIGIDATETGKRSMQENKMYATVLQDSVGQSTTAFELVYTVATKGTAIGSIANGLSAATLVTGEDPVTDWSILDQCYLVPFVPVTK
ncbi:substrate-binding domain-containing protein [Treponema brennaborense]|uniref:Galactose-binding protein n=1 Tax=Treponema brennaborense (strain DSM 12168 / CIP 105900 / DD5/3) TaxID=906968 RepID=F4LLA7_TREBD|nr:substrate-binding domain-containing protein [Treponema brennaborense]AEE15585.1 galactose-binding protein [Treponema brennaborense DSM 12168]